MSRSRVGAGLSTRVRTRRGATAFATIASAPAAATATAALARLLSTRRRTRFHFSGLGFGIRLRVGLRFRSVARRSLRRRCSDRVENDSAAFKRRASLGNRNARRRELRKIELRIANGFPAAKSSRSLLRFRFPIGAAEALGCRRVPLRGLSVLAGGFEHTRPLEGNH